MSSSHMSKRESLEARIKEASLGNVITCYAIRKIAAEEEAAYSEAGDAADRLGIKIRECELGCF